MHRHNFSIGLLSKTNRMLQVRRGRNKSTFCIMCVERETETPSDTMATSGSWLQITRGAFILEVFPESHHTGLRDMCDKKGNTRFCHFKDFFPQTSRLEPSNNLSWYPFPQSGHSRLIVEFWWCSWKHISVMTTRILSTYHPFSIAKDLSSFHKLPASAWSISSYHFSGSKAMVAQTTMFFCSAPQPTWKQEKNDNIRLCFRSFHK